MNLFAPERLFWLAALIAVCSVGLAAEPLARRLGGLNEPIRLESSITSEAEPPLSLEPVLALAPFGRVEQVEAPSAPDTSTLDLSLHGVVIALRPENSRAIVSEAGEPPQVYRPGDAIAAGTILAGVEHDRILVDVENRRETLFFPDTPQSPPQGAPAPARPSAAPAAAAGPSDTAIAIADLRQSFKDNPYRVLEDLGIEATRAGYRVGDAPAEPVRRAGLRPGDLVDSVNGQPVGNIELDRRFFDSVAATGQARIEVVRGDERLVFSFPLQ